MKSNAQKTVLAAVATLCLASGCAPGWTVIRASDPTALGNVESVAVAFDYSQMIVEGAPVEQWIAQKTEKDPEYPATWADLTGKFEDAFLGGMRGRCPGSHRESQGGGDVTLTVRPVTFGMGKYIVVSSWPTVMDVNIGARPDALDEETDEIALSRAYQASAIQPSVFQHISPIGHMIGDAACDFLRSKAPKR